MNKKITGSLEKLSISEITQKYAGLCKEWAKYKLTLNVQDLASHPNKAQFLREMKTLKRKIALVHK